MNPPSLLVIWQYLSRYVVCVAWLPIPDSIQKSDNALLEKIHEIDMEYRHLGLCSDHLLYIIYYDSCKIKKV